MLIALRGLPASEVDDALIVNECNGDVTPIDKPLLLHETFLFGVGLCQCLQLWHDF